MKTMDTRFRRADCDLLPEGFPAQLIDCPSAVAIDDYNVFQPDELFAPPRG